MKKIFLATSFSGQVDYQSGSVNPDFRAYIEELLLALRNSGKYEVFCAIEHEEWVVSDLPPEKGVEADLLQIESSDIFLAILSEKPSEGLQFEMGYATSKGKKVVVCTSHNNELGYFNLGLANLALIRHASFKSPKEFLNKVNKIIEV